MTTYMIFGFQADPFLQNNFGNICYCFLVSERLSNCITYVRDGHV